MSEGAGELTGSTWSVRGRLRVCAAAFTFLTRLPVGRVVAHGVDDLAGAAVYFPLVGTVVGVSGAAVFGAARIIWPPPIAIVLSVAFVVWMTGAFHEDALADSLDGFGGGWTREQVLSIMQDSRVGSYALIGVSLVVAAKLGALWAIVDAPSGTRMTQVVLVGRALIAAHTLGRWSSVVLMARYPYVRADVRPDRPSVGRVFVAGTTRAHVVAATALTIAVVGMVLGWASIAVCIVALAVTLLAGRYVRRRIGGVTGDALGAANQIVELAVYLVLAAHY